MSFNVMTLCYYVTIYKTHSKKMVVHTKSVVYVTRSLEAMRESVCKFYPLEVVLFLTMAKTLIFFQSTKMGPLCVVIAQEGDFYQAPL